MILYDFLTSTLKASPVVQGGLTLMVVGWIGYQLRSIPARVTGWARWSTTREVEIRDTHPHYDSWLAMLTEHAVRPGGPRTLEVRRWTEAERSTDAFTSGLNVFWARVMGKWCRVIVHRERTVSDRMEAAPFMISLEVYFATRASLERMRVEVARRADSDQMVQFVDVHEQHGGMSTIVLPKRHARTLCLPVGFFESIEDRLRDFGAAREQYEATGIPWRFGVLLSGPPGTGKTSLAHALASHLNLRLAVIPLADMASDRELMRAFRSVSDRAVVLIEDVDCAFTERSGKSAKSISFSGLLNCIDGVVSPHNGRILIMTTNHPEKLDAALIRPGRVDLSVESPVLERQAAMDYVDRVFPHVPARHAIVEEVLAGDPHDGSGAGEPTPAMLINRIVREKWRRPTGGSPVAPGGGVHPAARALRRESAADGVEARDWD